MARRYERTIVDCDTAPGRYAGAADPGSVNDRKSSDPHTPAQFIDRPGVGAARPRDNLQFVARAVSPRTPSKNRHRRLPRRIRSVRRPSRGRPSTNALKFAQEVKSDTESFRRWLIRRPWHRRGDTALVYFEIVPVFGARSCLQAVSKRASLVRFAREVPGSRDATDGALPAFCVKLSPDPSSTRLPLCSFAVLDRHYQ